MGLISPIGRSGDRRSREKRAFADSSSWNGVIEQLENNGCPVIAVANPLRGRRTDEQYVRGLLDNVDGPVVLAGHSYGGSVMSEAADGPPNVKALVYIASFLLDKGESTAQLAAPVHSSVPPSILCRSGAVADLITTAAGASARSR